MTSKAKSMLVTAVPMLSALVAAVLVGLVYPAPQIFPDTFQYLQAGRLDPTVMNIRTPAYGWLLLTAFRLQLPMLVVWLQAALWISCIMVSARLVFALTKSTWRAVAVGLLLVLGETAMMVTLPANWLLLTDAPYAEAMTLGLLLLVLGAATGKRSQFFLACALVGLMNVVRPLTIGVVVMSLAAFAVSRLWNRRDHRREVGGALALLFVPSLVLASFYYAAYGVFNTSAQLGQAVMNYTTVLTEPDDVLFADPALNRAFHETLNERKAPAGHAADDPYLMYPGVWHELSRFYASVVGPHAPPIQRWKVGALGEKIFLENVRQHPRNYLHLVGVHFAFFLLPDHSWRGYIWHPKQATDEWMGGAFTDIPAQTAAWKKANDLAGGTLKQLPVPRVGNQAIAALIDLKTYGLGLPAVNGPLQLSIAAALAALALFAAVRAIRSKSLRRRYLGLAILLLGSNTVLHAFVQAVVTLPDSRYRMPGLLTGELCILLTLVALSLPQNPPADNEGES